MTSITLTCGCELTETHVVAMCFRHDDELQAKKRAKESAADKMHAEFMQRLDEALRDRGRVRRGAEP